MRQITIGATAVELSSPNAQRNRWILEFTPTSIISGNTGRIFVGRGFIPTGVLNDPNQGDVLNAGAYINESKAFDADTLPFKGALWAISDTAGQVCTYDEETL